MVKSLNSQLNEKDGEIKFLKSKINQLNESVEKLKMNAMNYKSK